MTVRKTPASPLIEATLDQLGDLDAAGIRFVPEHPSPAMMLAGVRAGGVDKATVVRIYRAMIAAESFEDDTPASRRRAN